MHIPSQQDIERLHHSYAPTDEIFGIVYTHCQIVRDIARQLIEASSLDVDRELVEAGCLLHDIGVYKLYNADGTHGPKSEYIRHGILGEDLLKAEGYPEALWRIASHHIGTGLTVQDVKERGLLLPQQDYLAETTEELLVMYADKFHSKTQPPMFNTPAWYRAYVSTFGEDKAGRFDAMRAQFGEPDLEPLAAAYGHAIR
ncbi:MAG TPA: HD domain-containing protein [Candidatus Saccharimonadales bacterium]|jgi:uncharacterized protein